MLIPKITFNYEMRESIRQDSQDSHVFHQRFPEEKEILHNPVNPVG
jgi:hypothetical protein